MYSLNSLTKVYALHKKILCDGDFDSVESFLRKELKDEHLQLKQSSSVGSSSKLAPDPLLSSFIYNVSLADEPEIVQPCSSTDANLSEKSMLKRYKNSLCLSVSICNNVYSNLFYFRNITIMIHRTMYCWGWHEILA